MIDLDSKNGTFVNQKKASKEDMIDNDTLRLGKTEFKFKLPDNLKAVRHIGLYNKADRPLT